jgi:uncharacterized protein (TIRG00374 family)
VISDADAAPLPPTFSPRRIALATAKLAVLVVLLVVAISLLPGLSDVRSRFEHAVAGWIVVGACLELLSSMGYVLAFRSVFCTRMNWGTGYKIAMAELGADSVLPVGGAGGLALGVWALRRGGMSSEEIARKTVAFFLLTSAANVAAVALLGIGMSTRVLPSHGSILLAVVPAAGAVGAIVLVVWLGRIVRRLETRLTAMSSGSRLTRLAPALRAIGDGVDESIRLLRQHNLLLLLGIVGYMLFDVFVLWASFRSLHSSPEFTVVWMAYLIGQLGNLIPLPGGVGGVEAGLIGTLVLYGLPVATSTAAVLIYRILELWIPAILGSVAFIQLRALLRREQDAIELCKPGEVVEIVGRGRVVAG